MDHTQARRAFPRNHSLVTNGSCKEHFFSPGPSRRRIVAASTISFFLFTRLRGRCMAGLSPPSPKDLRLTRRGLLSHPRTLVLGAVAIVFTAFVLGHLPQLDILLEHALKSSHDEGLSIVLLILVGLASLFALLLLLLALPSIGRLFRSFEQRARFSERTAISLQSFRRSAEVQGISQRVAGETYRALTPHYPSRKMCIQLRDNLRHQLHLSEENILFLRSNVLNRCDRRELPFFSIADLHTVLDLMYHVESAPPQHVRETGFSRIDRPGPVGRGEIALVGDDGMDHGRRGADRIPAEFANRRTVSPDGGLHGAPTPARRRGDYNGIRRRASDLAESTHIPPEPASPPEIKPALFHPRNRSTDFTPRRRGDFPSNRQGDRPAKKPEN
jgi:hypothetical protein